MHLHVLFLLHQVITLSIAHNSILYRKKTHCLPARKFLDNNIVINVFGIIGMKKQRAGDIRITLREEPGLETRSPQRPDPNQ